ncbi:hypothetical protein SRHO_G00262680 [Serrasalmus rhombeus]
MEDPQRNDHAQQPVRVRGRGVRRHNRGRGRRGHGHRHVADEIRATLIDQVVNHGLTMAEAGRRVQPNVGRSTVCSIIQTFHRENRSAGLPHRGGRGPLFTPQQEDAICEMVIANNAIRLREIQSAIIDKHDIFENIQSVSISTIDRVLRKNQMRMKQLYRVPSERNGDRVKELRYQYVQVDEAGFNLTKGRRRGRNIIGHRATVDITGQQGGNITMCAAISEQGVLTHIPTLGPYSTQHLVTFIDTLYRDLIPDGEMALNDRENAPNLTNYVVIWDNVRFYHSNTIRQWVATHNRMLMLFLPPYSPFLNPIEEFFSAWRWKVYDRQPHTQMTLLAAMDAACEDITAEDCRGWNRHSKRFFPRCIAREDIRCDVDENMWPNRQERQEV